MESTYNMNCRRCKGLASATRNRPSVMVRPALRDAESLLPWTFLGYNTLFGFRCVKQ